MLVVNSEELWDQCKCWQPGNHQKPTNRMLLWLSLLATCFDIFGNNLCQLPKVWVPSCSRQCHVELFLQVLQCRMCTVEKKSDKYNHCDYASSSANNLRKHMNMKRQASFQMHYASHKCLLLQKAETAKVWAKQRPKQMIYLLLLDQHFYVSP